MTGCTCPGFLKTICYGVIGATVLVPFILFMALFQLPIYIYRIIITKFLAPLSRDRTGKAVTTGGQFHATDFLDDNNLRTCKSYRFWFAVKVVFVGDITLERLHKLIKDRWIRASNPNGMDLWYPEFQQYIEYWMGFMFWKQDTKFDLQNHIVHHEMEKSASPQVSDCYAKQLMEKVLSESAPPKRSPWQIHLIRHYKTEDWKDGMEQTVLLFRFHHVLADAMSIMQVILEGLFQDKMEYGSIPIQRKNNNNRVAARLASIIVSPLRFIVDFGYSICYFFNRETPWRRDNQVERSEMVEDGSVIHIHHKSPKIPLKKLKYIKNSFGVNLTSVLVSCLSAALIKSFNTGARSNVRAPMMLPAMGIGNKLRNQTFVTICELDTRQHLSPKERLLATNKYLGHAKQSFIPHIVSWIAQILSGSLAGTFAQLLSRRNISVCVSNVPGPQVGTGLDGNLQLGLDGALGAFADLVVLATSYCGYVTINVTANSRVLDRKQVLEIVESFCSQVDTLHKLAEELEDEVV